jgi:uncharacterized damage-inducible protein DinB
MHTFFQEFLERLTALHQDVLNAIDRLPTEALDWTPLSDPTADMNSINILVMHLCGAERYWIGDVALGEDSGRVRAAEFQVRGMDVGDLIARINASTEYARNALEKLSIEDLVTERTSLRDGHVFTVGWALLHALEHTAIHLGHIQITRQLWDQKSN